MRATTVFSRLLRLQGVWVKKVGFRRDAVVVHVALRRRRLICPHCEYSCRARKDTRPVDSVWRHLDLGTWCFEIRCRRRQIDCPRHGALAEGVPFARPGVGVHARFRVLGRVAGQPHRQGDHQAAVAIDWGTVGRIVKRVCDEELDPDRLNKLFEIGIDEVS